jgi:hypothetical protein
MTDMHRNKIKTHGDAKIDALSVSRLIFPQNLAVVVQFSLEIVPKQPIGFKYIIIMLTGRYRIILVKTMRDCVKSLSHRGEVQVPKLGK